MAPASYLDRFLLFNFRRGRSPRLVVQLVCPNVMGAVSWREEQPRGVRGAVGLIRHVMTDNNASHFNNNNNNDDDGDI